MRLFLGVDQSLNGTGLVVLDEVGAIRLQRQVQPAALRGVARLALIRAAVREALEYKPVTAALEGYSYNSTGRVFQLGEVGGLVQLAFYDAGVSFLVVTPAALKKFVANNHQASKKQMIDATKDKWGVDFNADDDQCDAHGLAQILRAVALNNSTVRHELEVVKELTAKPEKKLAAVQATRGKTKFSV